ncbi:hypothetical protein NC00_01080 [Xanthomonas cannabis pv. phaseoli]|uniref:Uncharacterized protein n=1 Tax=Xanthomonas cannabis pv. phaseoli TaxID=1885902 RepID=A0AB34PCY0_9XANT|nr:hypothetical protein NC00_01080 [Xanthomonas cannabis pv. phaseoli]
MAPVNTLAGLPAVVGPVVASQQPLFLPGSIGGGEEQTAPLGVATGWLPLVPTLYSQPCWQTLPVLPTAGLMEGRAVQVEA